MSYDIYLKEPSGGETVVLPVKHVMTGGTYRADYDAASGQFYPTAISEAWLNITYNYGRYYYEATEGDSRFAHDEVSAYYSNGTTGPIKTEYGIRGIYGKSGAESIEMLKDIISRIEAKYQRGGCWIKTPRHRIEYYEKTTDRKIDVADAFHMEDGQYYTKEYDEMISEGPNDNYWEATAANAIKPLYQLIAMAELRPDGIWGGD